jgi:AAA15 family ATPase/GTPase
MILNFTVGNYRSFHEPKTLTLQAKKISEEAKDNVTSLLSYNVLKTVALYGANSSGKSNLVKAMQAMELCVLGSVKLNDNDSLPYDPFLLQKGNNEPTLFEITFLLQGSCYRYGFKYSRTKIEEEWLFRKTTPRSKEQVLFIRNSDGIGVDEKHFAEGMGCESKTNDNRLFLSLCQQLGGTISKEVIGWFHTDINVVSGLNNIAYREYTKGQFYEDSAVSKEALLFFKKLQLGFNELLAREENTASEYPSALKEDFPSYAGKKAIEIDSIHNLYDKKGEVCGTVKFPFNDRESSGTQKLFDLSGPIFSTLMGGSILVIDELDAKMHPLISQYIIGLFNDAKVNLKNAQLIFTTHDTHLLSLKMLRRDQIWFTEKDDKEQTDLYNLTDILLPDGSKPRNDSNYEKNYIAGRYGAIPYIVNE